MRELCANHPEVEAVGTCGRCGSFVCGECRASGADRVLCKSCDLRLSQHTLVRHVPWIAIALITNGVMMVGMGLFPLVFGSFFWVELASMPPAAPGEDTTASYLLLVTLAVVGITHLVPGALQVWAGVRVRTFRGRGLAMAALTLGIVTVVGCYCAPTSIGLGIWGLIVLLDGEVARRFALPGSSASA